MDQLIQMHGWIQDQFDVWLKGWVNNLDGMDWIFA